MSHLIWNSQCCTVLRLIFHKWVSCLEWQTRTWIPVHPTDRVKNVWAGGKLTFYSLSLWLLVRTNREVVTLCVWLRVRGQPVFGSSLSWSEARGRRRQCDYDKKVWAFPLLNTHTHTHTVRGHSIIASDMGHHEFSYTLSSNLVSHTNYTSDPVISVTPWPLYCLNIWTTAQLSFPLNMYFKLMLPSHAPRIDPVYPVGKSFFLLWCVRVRHVGMWEQHGRQKRSCTYNNTSMAVFKYLSNKEEQSDTIQSFLRPPNVYFHPPCFNIIWRRGVVPTRGVEFPLKAVKLQ